MSAVGAPEGTPSPGVPGSEAQGGGGMGAEGGSRGAAAPAAGEQGVQVAQREAQPEAGSPSGGESSVQEDKAGEDGSERESLVKGAPAAAAFGAGWGWGSWTSVVSALQEAAVEAQRTAKGVVEQLEAEAREMEEREKQEAAPQGGKAQAAAAALEGPPGEPREKQAEAAVEGGEAKEAVAVPEAPLHKGKKDGKDSALGQGLLTLDDSMESIASGALHALGNAWKGGLSLMHTLEHSAGSLTQTNKDGSQWAGGAPSLLESGRGLAEQGLRVLELVGKETMDILVQETGIELEKDEQEAEEGVAEPQDEELSEEEVTFEHCFYIYGGPDFLEELGALSDHHSLVCSRARAKLSPEERAAFDALLQEVQALLAAELAGEAEAAAGAGDAGEEVRSMRESSMSTAAEMVGGFSSRLLTGLAVREMAGRTAEHLETLKAEGVHRISELCAVSVSRLLEVGTALLAATGGAEEREGPQQVESDKEGEDVLERARAVRAQARSMAADIRAVVHSFSRGMTDGLAAFEAAVSTAEGSAKKTGEADAANGETVASLLLRTATMKAELEADGCAAMERVQDGLRQLPHVLLATTLKATSSTVDSTSP